MIKVKLEFNHLLFNALSPTPEVKTKEHDLVQGCSTASAKKKKKLW